MNRDDLASRQTTRIYLRLLAIFAAALTLVACGITAPRSNEGYANLDSPGVLDTDRTMSLSIGPTLLRFAAAHIDDDPDTKALLKSLDGVRIRIYEVTGDSERISRKFERMGDKLVSDDWTPVMLVKDDGELIQMFAKSTSHGIQGLTLVTQDHDEVVVINMMGDIEPGQFQDVMLALDTDVNVDVSVDVDHDELDESTEVHIAATR